MILYSKSVSILLLFVGLYCVGLSDTAWGFQNFFNAPNSQITNPGRFYFQQQINSTLDSFEADTDLVYGVGALAEVGIAVNDIEVTLNPHGQSHAVIPTSGLVAGFQKKFKLSSTFGIALATKNGIALNNGRLGQWVSRGHLQGTLELPELKNLYATFGLYYFNGAFLNRDDIFIGIQAGLEFPLIPQKLHLIADVLTGAHAQGATVLGGCYWFSSTGNLSLGVQIPWEESTNRSSVVLELTLL